MIVVGLQCVSKSGGIHRVCYEHAPEWDSHSLRCLISPLQPLHPLHHCTGVGGGGAIGLIDLYNNKHIFFLQE